MQCISLAHPQSTLKCIISYGQKKHSREWLKALSVTCIFSIELIPVSSVTSQPNSSMQKSSSPELSGASHPGEVPHLVGAKLLQLHFVTLSVMKIQDNDHPSTAPTPARFYGSPFLSRQKPSHDKSVERTGSAQLHSALNCDMNSPNISAKHISKSTIPVLLRAY